MTQPGSDGIGCVGQGGIACKYSLLLWIDPRGSGAWEGQIQAYQNIGTQTDPKDLNFLGSDVNELLIF